MRYRVQDILLVSSLYDSFILAGGRPAQRAACSASSSTSTCTTPRASPTSRPAPRRSRWPQAERALQPDHHHAARRATWTPPSWRARCARRGLDVPVVLLAYDNRELHGVRRAARHRRTSSASSCGRATPASCSRSSSTSRTSATSPTTPRAVGVQVILVVEDNVRYYSSFLPVIYTELIAPLAAPDRRGRQPLAQAPAHAGAAQDPALRAPSRRPGRYFARYQERRPGRDLRHRVPARRASSTPRGRRRARAHGARARMPDVPILLQSSRPRTRRWRASVGAAFLLKGSPHAAAATCGASCSRTSASATSSSGCPTAPRSAAPRDLQDARGAAAHGAGREHRLPRRAQPLLAAGSRPAPSSRWPTSSGRARSRTSPTLEDLRADLIALDRRLPPRARAAAVVADFDRDDLRRATATSPASAAARSAARRAAWPSCACCSREHGARDALPGRARSPCRPAVVLGTDVFDRFLDDNDLRDFAIALRRRRARSSARFLAAPLPRATSSATSRRSSSGSRYPLAVRSSSLLEDSQYQPFTGVYETFMLPNDAPDARRAARRSWCSAIKRVYASTFSPARQGLPRAPRPTASKKRRWR